LTFARELLAPAWRAACGEMPPFVDVRPIVARRLRRRPGGVEQAVRLLGRAELPAPLGAGRAGRRLAALVALLEQIAMLEVGP
jgi:hypothetical protein